jgi:hypothetical protein
LQGEHLWPRARGQESPVDRSYHCDLAISGNSKLGDFSFVQAFAFEALDGIAPDFRYMHAKCIDDAQA